MSRLTFGNALRLNNHKICSAINDYIYIYRLRNTELDQKKKCVKNYEYYQTIADTLASAYSAARRAKSSFFILPSAKQTVVTKTIVFSQKPLIIILSNS